MNDGRCYKPRFIHRFSWVIVGLGHNNKCVCLSF